LLDRTLVLREGGSISVEPGHVAPVRVGFWHQRYIFVDDLVLDITSSLEDEGSR